MAAYPSTPVRVDASACSSSGYMGRRGRTALQSSPLIAMAQRHCPDGGAEPPWLEVINYLVAKTAECRLALALLVVGHFVRHYRRHDTDSVQNTEPGVGDYFAVDLEFVGVVAPITERRWPTPLPINERPAGIHHDVLLGVFTAPHATLIDRARLGHDVGYGQRDREHVRQRRNARGVEGALVPSSPAIAVSQLSPFFHRPLQVESGWNVPFLISCRTLSSLKSSPASASREYSNIDWSLASACPPEIVRPARLSPAFGAKRKQRRLAGVRP